ncbi:FHA domain-containing protein [Chengkuizengella marina]|uniref:FHA domain-containing protein n=1 Tax=Chengkuizengella marina TaxID=2507566 RepID=A0A6N9PY85_9BACL|nr:FHA domain-containing protein [Chengkuizengella marina]NBI27866.1 FHA domain-containing protein [Chengkuizengella marina]
MVSETFVGKIVDFHFDYIHQDGFYITLSKPNLRRDLLSNLQLNMIEANLPHQLLPMQIDEHNLNVRLLFEYTNKRMLSQQLKVSQITIKEFYKIVLQIVSIIHKHKAMLLNELNYIIHPDFIFIGRDVTDIYLTYVPVKQLNSKEPVNVQVKDLVLTLTEFVQDMKENELQKILTLLSENNVSLQMIKDEVLQWLDDGLEKDNNNEMNEWINFNHMDETNIPQSDDSIHPLSEAYIDKIISSAPFTKFLDIIHGKNHTIIITISVLIVAMLWRIYLTYLTSFFYIIAIGVSIFMIIVNLFIFLLAKKHDQNSTETESESKEASAIQTDSIKKDVSLVEIFEQSQDETYFKQLPNHTTILTPSDQTVLLESGNSFELNKVKQTDEVYLNISNSDHSETKRVDINIEHFLIGRDPTIVNYVINKVGVSRAHLEIIKVDEGQYEIKDLGSKNGSFLNDEKLTPYKTYSLNHNDRINFISVDMKFTIVNHDII